MTREERAIKYAEDYVIAQIPDWATKEGRIAAWETMDAFEKGFFLQQMMILANDDLERIEPLEVVSWVFGPLNCKQKAWEPSLITGNKNPVKKLTGLKHELALTAQPNITWINNRTKAEKKQRWTGGEIPYPRC